MSLSAFQILFWTIVYKTARFHVEGQATASYMDFSENARFYRVLPRSDEYYIDSLILPSVILCTLERDARKPVCVGVLYNSNSKTCKLLRFYITLVNVYRREYGDLWKYYPMKKGGNCSFEVFYIWKKMFNNFEYILTS